MPREVAGMTPHPPGPKPRAGSWASAHPGAPGPALPHARLPVSVEPRARSWLRRLTDPAMQSGSLIANSFCGSLAHLCHHMQKGKKSALKFFLPAPPPKADFQKKQLPRLFWPEPSTELGPVPGASGGWACTLGPRWGGWGGSPMELTAGEGDGLSQLPAAPVPTRLALLGPFPATSPVRCRACGL